MAILVETLQKVGVFAVGALARLGIFLAVLAAIALPLVAVGWAINRVRQARRRALGLHEVGGVTVRPGVRYAPSHTWLLAREGGDVQVGIDDLALRLLPAVTAVEAAHTGTRVKRGEPIASLWGGGRQLPILAPFDARIAGVNAAVIRDPSLVRTDGYGKGWLVALEPADDAWSALPSGADAEGWIASEARRWNQQIEQALGIAAADGGELTSPAPWIVGEGCWRDLVAAFTVPK